MALDELSKDSDVSKVGEAHISQPLCTAIQLALTDLLGSWGIHPTAVIGHSSGEIAAAYAAGFLTLESCMKIAYYRGVAVINLKSKMSGLKGAMMAVGANVDEIRLMIDVLQTGVVNVACINSPSSVTVSGDEPAIDELQRLVEEKHMFNRKLRVDVAYHSHHMNLVAEDYHLAIEGLKPKTTTSKCSFYSSLLGHCIDGTILQPAYWVENLTCSVRFSEALQSMCESLHNSTNRPNILIELGPHSALEGPVKQILKGLGGNAAKISYAPTLVRNKDGVESMLQLSGSLFCKGVDLNFEAINFPRSPAKPLALLTDMPRYPWNHAHRYWHESRISEKHKFRTAPRNDILGTLADYSNDLEPTWRNIIRVDDLPWLMHHQFQSLSVYPMAGYIAMALEAASQRAESRDVKFDKFELREVTVSRPLVISDADTETTITLRPYQEGTRFSSDLWDEFIICSWTREKGWMEHCKGLISVKPGEDMNVVDGLRQTREAEIILHETIERIEKNCKFEIDKQKMYKSLSELGATYGPTFQGIDNCRACDTYSMADIIVPDTASVMPMSFQPDLIIHPAFLDQLIQMYWPIFGAGRRSFYPLYMPSFIGKMTISRAVRAITKFPGAKLRAYCCGSPSVEKPKPTKMLMFATAPGESKEAIIRLDDLTMSPLLDSIMHSTSDACRELCYKLQWVPALENLNPNMLDISNHEIAIIHADSQPMPPLLSALEDSFFHLTGRTPVVGTLTDIDTKGKLCVFLAELDQSFLANLTPTQFMAIQKMLTTVEGILWVVRGAYQECDSPDSNMITGLSRTVRSETLLKFVTLDLDSRSKLSKAATAEIIVRIFKATFASGSSSVDPTSASTLVDATCPLTSASVDLEMEFMERAGKIYVPRIVDDAEMNKFVHQETMNTAPDCQPFAQKDRPLKMIIGSPGALDTLHFVDDKSVGMPLAADEIEIKIMATSMNFKDVMIAMGQLSSDYLGIECSGVVSSIGSAVTDLAVGDRVTAMSEGAYASYTRSKAASAFKIPQNMSFEDAATVPVVYCTAYYSLFDLGRLCEGETVLIHAAAGGVGQAAIILSQMVGAQIFATVGSVEKKDFLMKEYGIAEHHI